MNIYTTGVSIDPEFPVRDDPATQPIIKPKVTASESMARWRATQRIPDYRPRPGEMPMKQWRVLQAELTGLSPITIAMRLRRGKYPDLKIRRVNKRVVYVKE